MKRRPRHATRSLFGLPPRRRPQRAPGDDLAARLAGALRLGGRSALSLTIGGLMLVFIGLLVANFVGQVMQSARLEARRAELELEVAQIQAENVAIEGGVAFTESDVYVERVAREQLGFAREGDIVILPRVVAPIAPLLEASPAPGGEADAQGSPALDPTPNWRLWWRAIFPAEL
jgi:cell division protein FtsB